MTFSRWFLFLYLASVGNVWLPTVLADCKKNVTTTDFIIFRTQRNISEYYFALDISFMIEIFASLMFERRIIFSSSNLSTVSCRPFSVIALTLFCFEIVSAQRWLAVNGDVNLWLPVGKKSKKTKKSENNARWTALLLLLSGYILIFTSWPFTARFVFQSDSTAVALLDNRKKKREFLSESSWDRALHTSVNSAALNSALLMTSSRSRWHCAAKVALAGMLRSGCCCASVCGAIPFIVSRLTKIRENFRDLLWIKIVCEKIYIARENIHVFLKW